MGNQKWTAEEEDAFQRGVQKYAAGKWANILKDPEFSKALARRTNVDLKDKWRNLNGHPSRNPKTPKAKPLVHVPSSSEVNATPTPVVAAAPPSANVIVRNAAIAPQNDANIYPKLVPRQ